ncbi:unnamed protein product [Scytosiphon promiscuus]
MDGDEMKRQFEHILQDGGRKADFDVTPEEATKFKAAMADPEFQAMLRDYMEEMQDPAQRAEQELYISELESQNRVPEGKEVVHPLPGFVIKTKFTRMAKDAESEKLFANVVTSDKLAKPYSKTSGNRSGGETWSLPVAVGPLRMEKDKAGGSTTTFDVCYHPEALVRAQRLDAFRDLVALSSLERVEDAFLRGTEQKITVDKNYRILKGVKYKSGPCATMMVAKGDISRAKEEGRTAAPVSAASEAKNDTMRKNPKKEVKSKATRPLPRSPSSAAAAGKPPAPAEAAEPKQAGNAQASLPPGVKMGNGGTTYKLVESGAFEIADHVEDRVRQTPTPQAIIVTVTLPADAEPTRKLDVVVAPKRLTIGVLGDPEDGLRRYLDVRLPYEVEDDSKCSAARDKEGVLKITMPVKPPPPSQHASSATPVAPAPAEPEVVAVAASDGDGVGDGDGDGGVEEHKGNPDGEEGKFDADAADEAEQKNALDCKTQQPKPDHSRWREEATVPSPVQQENEENVSESAPLPPAPLSPESGAPGAFGEGAVKKQHRLFVVMVIGLDRLKAGGLGRFDQGCLFLASGHRNKSRRKAGSDSRARLRASFLREQKLSRAHGKKRGSHQSRHSCRCCRRHLCPRRCSFDSLEERLVQGKDEEFIECESFARKVPGYEFKNGDKGTGYYRDDRGKKEPAIAWNENVKTVCGMVQVPNIIDSTVHYAFLEGGRDNTDDNSTTTMVLSFDARLPERSSGGGEGVGVERYRTELVIPGGVDTRMCSHNTATENMVLKLVKAPVREWGSSPVSRTAQVTEVASRIDQILDSAASVAAAAAAARDGGSAKIVEEGQGSSAPRHAGGLPAKPSDEIIAMGAQIE